jgi:hypothetical protein
MIRATIATDSTVRHLWTGYDATVTECGLAGDPGSRWANDNCRDCLRQYGADLAAAFPRVDWMGASGGLTRHAFDRDAPPAKDGRLTPVCGVRTYTRTRLLVDELMMRCPHCIEELRYRRGRG